MTLELIHLVPLRAQPSATDPGIDLSSNPGIDLSSTSDNQPSATDSGTDLSGTQPSANNPLSSTQPSATNPGIDLSSNPGIDLSSTSDNQPSATDSGTDLSGTQPSATNPGSTSDAQPSATDSGPDPPPAPEESGRNFRLFVLAENSRSLDARLKVISEWREVGGVLLIGYEMFRMLSLSVPSLGGNKMAVKKRKQSKKGSADNNMIDLDENEREMDALIGECNNIQSTQTEPLIGECNNI